MNTVGTSTTFREHKEVTLASILEDPRKKNFITSNKINLTYCDITRIGQISSIYHNITRLHLSHNKIDNLDGIEQFNKLNNVSLGYNKLKNWNELLKISCKNDIQEIIVTSNPLDLNPNYMFKIYDNFPNILKIDDTVITQKDKKSLNKHILISSLILPFFIKLENDQKAIMTWTNRIKLMHDIRSQSQRSYDINGNNNTNNKKFQLDQLKNAINDLYIELKYDLMSLNIDKIIKDNMMSKSGKAIQTLKNLKKLMKEVYANFDDLIVDDRSMLYQAYKTLFHEIMLKYSNTNDKSLDYFLTQEVIQNKSYDFEKFANDTSYAFDCILYEFYKLMPVQASIINNVSVDFDKVNNKSTRLGMITSVDIDYNDPTNLKNLTLTHFPIFPLNNRYMTFLLDVMLSHLEMFDNVIKDFHKVIKGIASDKDYIYDTIKPGFQDTIVSYNLSPMTTEREDRLRPTSSSTLKVNGSISRSQERFLIPNESKSPNPNLDTVQTLHNWYSRDHDKDIKESNLYQEDIETNGRVQQDYIWHEREKKTRTDLINGKNVRNGASSRDELYGRDVKDKKDMVYARDMKDKRNEIYVSDTRDIGSDNDDQIEGNSYPRELEENEMRIRERLILPIIIFTKLKERKDRFFKDFFSNLKEYSKKRLESIEYSSKRRIMATNKINSMMEIFELCRLRKLYRKLIKGLRNKYHKNLIFEYYIQPLKKKFLCAWNDLIHQHRYDSYMHYRETLQCKVFYGITKLRFNKLQKLKRILIPLSKSINTMKHFYYTKWKIITTASKFLYGHGLPILYDQDINYLNINDQFPSINALANRRKITHQREKSGGRLKNFSRDHGDEYYNSAYQNEYLHHHNNSSSIYHNDNNEDNDEMTFKNKTNNTSSMIRTNSNIKKSQMLNENDEYILQSIKRASKRSREILTFYAQKYGPKKNLESSVSYANNTQSKNQSNTSNNTLKGSTMKRSISPNSSLYRKCNSCDYNFQQ